MKELEIKINKILAWDMPHAQLEHRDEAVKHIMELPELKAIQVQAKVKPDACGKWKTTKPEKPCYFIHRYTKKDSNPDLYDAYVDGGVLSVANIQDDEFICTMEEFADGEFYIVEYHQQAFGLTDG